MKKILISIFAVIVALCIVFFIYLSVAIKDYDVFYYKSAKLCSDLIKPVMKSPASYSYTKLGVLYKEEPQSALLEKVKEKDYLKKWFDNGRLSLSSQSAIVSYSAKNSYGVDLENVASCDYDVFILDKKKPFSVDMVVVNLGGEQYKGEALLINFYSPLKVFKLTEIGIKDKFDYLFDKSKFSASKL